MMPSSDYNLMLNTVVCFFYLNKFELDCLLKWHTGNDANSHLINLKRHLSMTLFHCDLGSPESSSSTIKEMPKTKERTAAFEMY